MRKDSVPFFGEAPQMELMLRLPGGAPWPLRFSADIQPFIGHYVRVEGMDCGAPLLTYRMVHPVR
jgi:hypothetical protein